MWNVKETRTCSFEPRPDLVQPDLVGNVDLNLLILFTKISPWTRC